MNITIQTSPEQPSTLVEAHMEALSQGQDPCHQVTLSPPGQHQGWHLEVHTKDLSQGQEPYHSAPTRAMPALTFLHPHFAVLSN